MNKDALKKDLLTAIDAAVVRLLAKQADEGYWAGELFADASVTAGYIPLMHFLGCKVAPERLRKIKNALLHNQNENGSWSLYAGGPGDLNVSIQTYFSLKLAGLPAESACLRKACRFIKGKGGLKRANVFTSIWLALFGQCPWSTIPPIPPELILLPSWCYVNIYEFASWSRATIVALSVVNACRPLCPVPPETSIEELYETPADCSETPSLSAGKTNVVNLICQVIKFYDLHHIRFLRKKALRLAEQWILKHQESDGSWGGIMLPYIYSLIALKCLGYGGKSPPMLKGIDGIESFIIETENEIRMQPATSPVWDTAWSILSLSESGLDPTHPSLQRAARWLLKKEIRSEGDWSIKNPQKNTSAWSFEFVNDWYPDVDDTIEVIRALSCVQFDGISEEKNRLDAIERGLRWVLSMQSMDGGWAAFDRDNNHLLLNQIPFAEFMSPLDPTCADVTAHVLEYLYEIDFTGTELNRAVDYLKHSRTAEGTWAGRWGVNYLYGTSMVLASLYWAKNKHAAPETHHAIGWIISKQNPDNGWGESCDSYWADEHIRSCVSSPSQTAWALLGLAPAGDSAINAVMKGIGFLIQSQLNDGGWEEEQFTGTGFPKAFFLKYDLYKDYFPLLALSRWAKILGTDNEPTLKTESTDASILDYEHA